jgi:hypothetical protein
LDEVRFSEGFDPQVRQPRQTSLGSLESANRNWLHKFVVTEGRISAQTGAISRMVDGGFPADFVVPGRLLSKAWLPAEKDDAAE